MSLFKSKTFLGLAAVVAFAWLFYLVLFAFCHPYLDYWDSMVRYAPMADAFARGDWAQAFHPRFCFAFQSLAGCACRIFGFQGDFACQFVAISFWCLSAFPLFAIVRRTADEPTAWIAVVILFAIPEFKDMAISGVRDDVRIFPTLLMAWGSLVMMREASARDARLASVAMSVGIFLTIGLRLDCLLTSSLTLMFFGALCFKRRKRSALVLPSLSWFVAVLINCAIVCRMTGYFVPGPHFITYLESIP